MKSEAELRQSIDAARERLANARTVYTADNPYLAIAEVAFAMEILQRALLCELKKPEAKP